MLSERKNWSQTKGKRCQMAPIPFSLKHVPYTKGNLCDLAQNPFGLEHAYYHTIDQRELVPCGTYSLWEKN